MKEVRQIWRGKVVNGLEGLQNNFEFNPKLNRKPVELLQNGSYMMDRGSSGNDAGG